MSVELVVPRDVKGYHKLAIQIWDLLPWKDKDVGKMDPADLEARAEEFVRVMRLYCENDLYFLSRYVLTVGDRKWSVGARQMDHAYLFNHYKRLELYRDEGQLDRKWLYHARGHYKTTSVQDILIQEWIRNPNIRIAYYSRVKDPMATDRAGGVRLEAEHNELLHVLYPNIFWGKNPREAGAPSWSPSSFTGKRVGTGLTMTEPTVQCSGIGLQGGLYTGGHPDIRVFDDIVDQTNAFSTELAHKTARQVQAATFIADVTVNPQNWFIGTKWAEGDPYDLMQDRGLITSVWVESCVDSSKPRPDLGREGLDLGGGEPRFLTVGQLKKQRGKKDSQEARADYFRQYVCDVKEAQLKSLSGGDFMVYDTQPHEMALGSNLYLLMDPGGSPGVDSTTDDLDDTVIWVVAARGDRNLAIIDGECDIISPSDRARKFVSLHRKWSARGYIAQSRVERVGSAGDVDLIIQEQMKKNYVFDVWAIHRGGNTGRKTATFASIKKDRIYRALQPLLADGRLWLPKGLMRNRRKERVDLCAHVRRVTDQFKSTSDEDVLDCMALLREDPDKAFSVYRGKRQQKKVMGRVEWPNVAAFTPKKPEIVAPNLGKHNWMLAGTGVRSRA